MRSPSERFWPVAAGHERQLSVVVGDPNYVQALKLPEKGKMTAHPGCGFDSLSAPSSVASASEVFNKIVGQAKAIIYAKEAAAGGELELATVAGRSSGIRERLHLK
jgi:hypothetical protein